MDKSVSNSNLSLEKTPPNKVTQRIKKRGEEVSRLDLNDFKEEIKGMISSMLSAQRSELRTITSNLKEIQETSHKIENSITFLSNQNEELCKKINLLETQTRKDREHIAVLENKIEDMQRTNRKTCIEIKNVPKKTNETNAELINMVLNLSRNVNCKIEKSDIKDIFRVQGRKEGKKDNPIIFEVGSTILRSDFLKSCKSFNIKNKDKLRAIHLGFTKEENTPVFVSEQLTARAARLFYLARDLSKSKNYKFCWTSFGKVYVRKDESSPVMVIQNEAQVNHLLQKK